MPGGVAFSGPGCASTVAAAPFGCTLVNGWVDTYPADDPADAFAPPVGACFCGAVAIFGAVAAAGGFCIAGCCLYTAAFEFFWFCPGCGFCPAIPRAAQTPAHKRPSIRIHPTRLIMESSGARRFHLHLDCVEIL